MDKKCPGPFVVEFASCSSRLNTSFMLTLICHSIFYFSILKNLRQKLPAPQTSNIGSDGRECHDTLQATRWKAFAACADTWICTVSTDTKKVKQKLQFDHVWSWYSLIMFDHGTVWSCLIFSNLLQYTKLSVNSQSSPPTWSELASRSSRPLQRIALDPSFRNSELSTAVGAQSPGDVLCYWNMTRIQQFIDIQPIIYKQNSQYTRTKT